MSYRSRLYNHRNAQSVDGNDKPFFSKKQKENDSTKKNTFFQAKLEVNKPGDKYEQEADAVAGKVVGNKKANGEGPAIQRLSSEEESKMPSTNDGRMAEDKRIQEKPMVQKMGTEPEKEKMKGIRKMELPEKKKEEGMPAAIQKMSADPEKEKMKGIQKMELPEKKKEEGMPAAIQKMSAPEKEKEKPGIQKMDDPTKEEKDKKKSAAIQRKPDTAAGTASPKVASKIENRSGNGNRLPKKALNEMNASFGKDFSNVNIHNDGEAANLNRELQAQAFTHGSDIYFNEGKFDPDSEAGKFLLAHELTHVVQQNGGIHRDIESQSEGTAAEVAEQPVAEELAGGQQLASEGEIIDGWVVYSDTAKKGGSWPWALNNPGSLTVGANHINDGGMYGDFKRTKGFLRIFPSWQNGYDAIATYLNGWPGATLRSIAFLPYGERGRENEYLKIFMDATKKSAETKISDLTAGEVKNMVDAIVNQEGGSTAGQELSRSTAAKPPQLPNKVFGK